MNGIMLNYQFNYPVLVLDGLDLPSSAISQIAIRCRRQCMYMHCALAL